MHAFLSLSSLSLLPRSSFFPPHLVKPGAGLAWRVPVRFCAQDGLHPPNKKPCRENQSHQSLICRTFTVITARAAKTRGREQAHRGLLGHTVRQEEEALMFSLRALPIPIYVRVITTQAICERRAQEPSRKEDDVKDVRVTCPSSHPHD